jgi:KDO2-lipid IV(A) lauroyltransferase
LILLSAYYGPYDLLPTLIGFNGVRGLAVYKPHVNPHFDAIRQRVRARGGFEFASVEQAMERVPAALAAGRAVALIADHEADKRGIEATFLGLPTRAPKTAPLLAMQYRAAIVVSGIRRIGATFRFELLLADVIVPADWESQPDAPRYITERYLRGLESLVYQDPTQYVWAYGRWGERVAAELTRAHEPAAPVAQTPPRG